MTRLTTAQLAETARYEWLMERVDAEEHPCPTCLAAVAVTCSNVHTGRPLEHQPAHVARIALVPASAVPSPRRPSAGGPASSRRRGRCSRAVRR